MHPQATWLTVRIHEELRMSKGKNGFSDMRGFHLLISASFCISVESPPDLLWIKIYKVSSLKYMSVCHDKYYVWLLLTLYATANITPFVTNLPSASSCPSTSNRSLFRGFGVEPRSRVLLKERSLLLTIWLIFWNRLDSCRWKQKQKQKSEWGKQHYNCIW